MNMVFNENEPRDTGYFQKPQSVKQVHNEIVSFITLESSMSNIKKAFHWSVQYSYGLFEAYV